MVQDETGHGGDGIVLSVPEAAAMLGLTESGVRKRISRGTLPARKVDGQWQVVLSTSGQSAPSRPVLDRTQPDATGHDSAAVVSASARSQLESIRDEWLQPLIDQLSEKSEEIGRLRERAETASAARAEAEIHRLAAEQARRDEADQADQLVNLLEDRIRELERRSAQP